MAQTTSVEAVLDDMASKIMAAGWAQDVVRYDPNQPPENVLASVVHSRGFVEQVTLTTLREIHVALIRLYKVATDRDGVRDGADADLDNARAQILADYWGDFDLGGNAAYMVPSGVARFEWRWGYLQVGATMCRILDIFVPFRVDDRTTTTQ